MKTNYEELIRILESFRGAVGALLDYTKQHFGGEPENMCGEWVRDDTPDTVVRIYRDEDKYCFQQRKSNALNSHIRVLEWEIINDNGNLYLKNGLETAISYDRENDSLVTDAGTIYKRKKE